MCLIPRDVCSSVAIAWLAAAVCFACGPPPPGSGGSGGNDNGNNGGNGDSSRSVLTGKGTPIEDLNEEELDDLCDDVDDFYEAQLPRLMEAVCTIEGHTEGESAEDDDPVKVCRDTYDDCLEEVEDFFEDFDDFCGFDSEFTGDCEATTGDFFDCLDEVSNGARIVNQSLSCNNVGSVTDGQSELLEQAKQDMLEEGEVCTAFWDNC